MIFNNLKVSFCRVKIYVNKYRSLLQKIQAQESMMRKLVSLAQLDIFHANKPIDMTQFVRQAKKVFQNQIEPLSTNSKNNRKTTQKVRLQQIKSFIMDLLVVQENMAKLMDIKNPKIHSSMQATYKHLCSVFEKEGLKRIEAKKGQRYLEEIHEKVSGQGDIVQDTVSAGWQNEDGVLRKCKIKVGKA